MKLYYVRGIRHHAVVMADNKGEALELAIRAAKDERDEELRVLYGSVGDWEHPEAEELKLLNGYKLVKNS